ncbi:putative transcription initiation factor IIF subunit alpha [Calycina marina]|uniref:Transcription initiation factor IIF subunit alpha n=1 Tax=Calycina marina TaxID=1763456 RepID=A0A9P7YWM2_9HELO|nr:putative transcription initiation factor IIF subunit alpha [Calycina marina]
MSASPSGFSNGQVPTPNGGPRPQMRNPLVKKPVDKTLVARKKKPVRAKVFSESLKIKPTDSQAIRKPSAPQHAAPVPGPPRSTFGFTGPQPTEYQDFPLYTTKRALMQGMRHHVARFSTTSKTPVDPTDQNEFTRPIALHRRDPRQPVAKDVKDPVMEDAVDSKEQERMEILKAEKEAQRAADLAQIAPSKGVSAIKKQAFRNEKTSQVYRQDTTAEEKKESDLRYEEALPWHMEDADYKHIWIGNYEAALSDTNVVLVADGSIFRMVPVEKWYKFSRKGQFKTYTAEEAQTIMDKGVKEPRWLMQSHETKQAIEKEAQNMYSNFVGKPLFTVKQESATAMASKNEYQDADDLDFNDEDLFQDDDDTAQFETNVDDLDEKESKERIKREQLGANFFDQANEADVDEEEEEEKKMKERLDKEGKKLKKSLAKREKMTIYEESDSDPYADTSTDSDSDDEKKAEADRKKAEDEKKKAAESKLASGASSKGTITPSGRSKHVDALKKTNNLKRSGSLGVSESSGNESSRKKKKTKHSSQPAKGTSTSGSRSMSPVPSSSAPASGQTPRKSSIVKLNVNSSKLSEIQSAPPHPSPTAAISDSEATGGEMSDGGPKRKKIKLRTGGSNSGTNSRAGSPAPGRAANASRAGSPVAVDSGAGALLPLQADEIIALLTPAGISIGELRSKFGNRIGDPPRPTTQKEFIRLVKENVDYGKDKLLRPKV